LSKGKILGVDKSLSSSGNYAWNEKPKKTKKKETLVDERNFLFSENA
jgi:hypothetical protein